MATVAVPTPAGGPPLLVPHGSTPEEEDVSSTEGDTDLVRVSPCVAGVKGVLEGAPCLHRVPTGLPSPLWPLSPPITPPPQGGAGLVRPRRGRLLASRRTPDGSPEIGDAAPPCERVPLAALRPLSPRVET